MGYKIRYGQDDKLEINLKRNQFKKNITMILILCLPFTGILWPQMRQMLCEVLFPWLREPTVFAFNRMMDQIGAGDNIAAAFAEFCNTVISHAGNFV